jgi:uncharacterized protein (TIGR02271 family)
MVKMKTVVGLYQDKTTANQVVQALVNYGISQDIVNLTTGTANHDLSSTLTSEGVAVTEAEAYAEGVRQGGSLVSVQVDDDETNDVVSIMNRYQPLDVHNLSASSTKATTQQTAAKTPSSQRAIDKQSTKVAGKSQQSLNERGDMSIPIVEEELNVGKRQVEQGGVRVHTRIEEQPVEQQVTLHKEEVHVERRPVNRVADASDLNAFKEGSFELKETAEEAVVEKRARVVEEVVIKKDTSDRTETLRDTVRKTKVDVDQTGTSASTSKSSFDVAPFRTDYQTKYANSGRTFEQYQPAYQYGYTLANDTRYQGRNWNDIEADARTTWTQNNQGSAWEDFKDAVRHSWEQTKRAASH